MYIEYIGKYLKNNKKLIALILLYRIIVDFIYVKFAAPYYDYWHMNAEVSVGRVLVFSLIGMICIPFVISHINNESASNYVLLMWDFMYFIPGIGYLCFNRCETVYAVSYFMFYITVCIINYFSYGFICIFDDILKRIDNILSTVKFNNLLFYIVLSFVISYVVICMFCYGKFSFDLKRIITHVYEVRKQFKTDAVNYPTLFLYLKGGVSKLIPLLVYCLVKNNKIIYGLILSFLQVCLFCLGANKVDLFLLFIAIGIAFIRIDTHRIVEGFSVISILSLVLCYVQDTAMSGVPDMLIRRMMILPNHLSYYYYLFFRDNPNIWFTNSLLKFMGMYPYDKDVGLIIGEFWNKSEVNANNGLFGGAFADCGFWSIAIYPMLYGFMLFLFDIICNRIKDKELVAFAAVIISIIYIDSNYFTALFTHGVVLLFITLFLWPKRDYSE